MSRPVSTGAILETVIEGRANGQVTLSSFHYRLNNAAEGSDGTDLVGVFDGLFNIVGGIVDLYSNCCANDFELRQVRYQWVYPTRYTAQLFVPVNPNGTVIQSMLMSNVAVALLKTTFITGRTQRGILHMPGVPSTFVVDSQVSVAGTAAYLDLCANIPANLITVGDEQFEPIIFHRGLPVTSPHIEECRVENAARIMRRRTVGVGE